MAQTDPLKKVRRNLSSLGARIYRDATAHTYGQEYYYVSIHDGVIVKSELGMKAKHSSGGRPFIEEVTGDDLYRKTNRWMNLSRVCDREKDLYEEIITDPITGEVVHECIEPLSKHTGHGTAEHKEKAKA